MSNFTSLATPLQGWTDSPNNRGSIDIIYSCLFTIFICVWSVLCINVCPNESPISEYLRKLRLAFLCILGPDFLLLLAVGQFESARKSHRQFKSLNLDGWTLRHAFYADMGGFVVKSSDGISWPLDANQLFYLIERGWIKGPVLESKVLLKKGDIDDRNKQNTLVRLISLAQTAWFLVNCVARACQDLPLTTLELTTIGFIATTFGITVAWYHKPADVKTQQMIELDASVSEIHALAGLDDTYTWYDTPLDFVDAERTYYAVALYYCWNIWARLSLTRQTSPRPITKRADDNFPQVSKIGILLVGLLGCVSWGANLAAWNLEFPSQFEKDAWRVCSLVMIATIGLGDAYHEIILKYFPNWRQNARDRFIADYRRVTDTESADSESKFSEKVKRRRDRTVLWLSNNTFNGDPSWTMELRVLIPALFCAVLYALARFYLLVEDLIGFRAQNQGVYELVNWAAFLPHV